MGSRIVYALLLKDVEMVVIEHKTAILGLANTTIIKGGTPAITANFIDEFKPDVIFHCARPSLPRFKKFGRIIAANIAAGINRKLIGQIEKSQTKPKLVFASGSLMYGNSREPF